MNPHLICFCGKKGSGKTTASNYLHGVMGQINGVFDEFTVNNNGRLVVKTEEGSPTTLDPRRVDYEFLQWAEANLFPFVKPYSFATYLKIIAQKIFGLTEKQCYGTNDEKNTYTDIKWGNLTKFLLPSKLSAVKKKHGEDYKDKYITARDFLQIFGTDCCRRIKDDCWARSTLNLIEQEQPLLAVIDDGRFENEIDTVNDHEGITVKLTRTPHDDSHESESAVDDIPDSKFDIILHNDVNIEEQNKMLITELQNIGWKPMVLQPEN